MYFPSASLDSPGIVTPHRDLHAFFYAKTASPPIPSGHSPFPGLLSSQSASTLVARAESPASAAAILGSNSPLRQPSSPAVASAAPPPSSPPSSPVRGGAPASPASPASQGCDKQFSYTATTGCSGGNGAAVGYVFGGLLCILLVLFVSLTAICFYRRRYARYLSTTDPPLRSDLSGIQPMATTHSHQPPRKDDPAPLTPEPCPGVWVTLPGPVHASASSSGSPHPPLLQVAWPESYDRRLARAVRANAASTAASASRPSSSAAAGAGAAGAGGGVASGRSAAGAGQSLLLRRPSTGGSMRAGSHVPSPDSSVHSISSLEPSVHLSMRGGVSFSGSGRGVMFGSASYSATGLGGMGVGAGAGGGAAGGVVVVGDGVFGVASGAMLPVREQDWNSAAIPSVAAHAMTGGGISATGIAAVDITAGEPGSGVGPRDAATEAAEEGAVGAAEAAGGGASIHGSMRSQTASAGRLPISLEETLSLMEPPLQSHSQHGGLCEQGSHGMGAEDGSWDDRQGQGQVEGGARHGDGVVDGAGLESGEERAEGRQHGGNIWQTVSSFSIACHLAHHS
ncbi:hypothetical protein CLOM_g22830 [Closterium sp. NIES-68]|nr:hypothetical protein CLOM_g22830 [Closterium sp. NIES-68]GJP82609.1 hypothetical protein CLOP_g12847 [Closterium sp. NIES-67]